MDRLLIGIDTVEDPKTVIRSQPKLPPRSHFDWPLQWLPVACLRFWLETQLLGNRITDQRMVLSLYYGQMIGDLRIEDEIEGLFLRHQLIVAVGVKRVNQRCACTSLCSDQTFKFRCASLRRDNIICGSEDEDDAENSNRRIWKLDEPLPNFESNDLVSMQDKQSLLAGLERVGRGLADVDGSPRR